jgi:murein L,D-transpeptidase YcbB/YkuD
MPPSARAVSCLSGIAAIAMAWTIAMLAAVAAAQEPPPQRWDRTTAESLLRYVEEIGSHGLNPAYYQPGPLRRALDSGDSTALEKQADASFGEIAADLAIGHVRPGERGRYYIAPNSLDPVSVARMIDMAIAAHTVAWVLDSFAPQNPEYAALRRALAGADGQDPAKRTQLKATLERWRWLPHNPGSNYLVVNIPEYRVRLIQGGKEVDNHKVIVGKPNLPTPQFSTPVVGVILNPVRNVPQSIIRESLGKLVRANPGIARDHGYSWTSTGGHLQVTQKPGPGNSLGQIKLDMPNPLTVYLHDTPSKLLFDKDDRTFSHGCIRTQDPFGLAEKLLAGTGWNRSRIDAVVASQVTTRVALPAPLPAYVVYMTAVPQADGTIAYYKDAYKLDAALVGKLN